jgi:hypothetical protein
MLPRTTCWLLNGIHISPMLPVVAFKLLLSFLEFQAGWFADPIYFGAYPKSMVSHVGDLLPSFTLEQSKRIKGSADFYGR